jgi:hypothetical protein
MKYLKNLKERTTQTFAGPFPPVFPRPAFASKAEFRDWCADGDTDHCFYSLNEGDTPGLRISSSNPVRKVIGIVADYDAPVDWSVIDVLLTSGCTVKPTWRSKTFSGYIRLVWLFDEELTIEASLFDAFMFEMAASLKLTRILSGFDRTSLNSSQYFEVGEEWVRVADPLTMDVVHTALFKAIGKKPPQTEDTSIPIADIAREMEERFPSRWEGDFEIGARGPLFWIDDGIDRHGCQVVEDGMVCYSDRAGKGFVSWREIFGGSFVKDYEQKKFGGLSDTYWFNGRSFFKLLYGAAVAIGRDQLILELRQAGYATKCKKNQNLSEVETAILHISNNNRVDEIAPVIFSKERVVTFNGHRILNNATVNPTIPADDGDPSLWSFCHDWIGQFFAKTPSSYSSTDYFYAWLKRFYEAVLDRTAAQGQALLLVGPTGRGKSLLSNHVIAGLVGGMADASDYLAGRTSFNKELAGSPTWLIDDATSAASFADQRKATELIKRAVANPRIEYHAKYADAVSLPWTGRVAMTLNMDANSLSVLPSLDTSNRDKLLALRISDSATTRFPPNSVVEDIIKRELPHLARWLVEWVPPAGIMQSSRFGVDSYIDLDIASAAYDNSSRSAIAELVDFFSKKCRMFNSDLSVWEGTLTDFQAQLHQFNDGRPVGSSNNLEFVRRGMYSMEEASLTNPNLRPVLSVGTGGGKLWRVSLEKRFDIENIVGTIH